MRAVVQRVERGAVSVSGRTVGAIGAGLVVLVGVAHSDTHDDARTLAAKLLGLRIFPDAAGRMNRSIVESGGEVLVVSQFTLLADVRRGRRPSFTTAADPEVAVPVIDTVVATLEEGGVTVATGEFGAMMSVDILNDGPVTIVIDVIDGRVA